jgi:hypothetical protein
MVLIGWLDVKKARQNHPNAPPPQASSRTSRMMAVAL